MCSFSISIIVMCACSISVCAYVFTPLSRFSPVLSPSLSFSLPLSLSLSLTHTHTHTHKHIDTHTSILQKHKYIHVNIFLRIDSKRTTNKQVKVIYRRMKTEKGGKEYERVVGGGQQCKKTQEKCLDLSEALQAIILICTCIS